MLEKYKRYPLYVLVYCVAIDSAQAHQKKLAESPTSAISASTSITYRSDGSTQQDQLGLIPGAMLGGEALPVERGIALDDGRLMAIWVSPYGYDINSTLAAHQHNGSSDIKLEDLWLSMDTPKALGMLNLDIGKMPSEITEISAWHASQSLFSEASLLSDVFWGRHFTDAGIRLSKKITDFHAGMELWNGDNWPATPGDGSASLYAKWASNINQINCSIGFWGMHSNAKNRYDDRYSGGHNHGESIDTNLSEDYKFTGDINTIGIYGELNFNLNTVLQLMSKLEWIQQASSGDLANSNQTSKFESEYNGISINFAIKNNKHELAIRFDRLVLENDFFEYVPTSFVGNANLLNNGVEPNKTSFIWSYQWQPNLYFRSEIISDQSYTEDESYRANFGIKWLQSWPFYPPQ